MTPAIDENTITDAVVQQMSTTEDPRLKQIMEAAVRHLHAFAREVNLTPEEWLRGIGFLTAVGQKCTPYRQEFILLSDTLGLSSLVNALHDKRQMDTGTNTSLLGPFYRQGAPEYPLGGCICTDPDMPPMGIYGRVLDTAGHPLAGALVQIWQCDDEGSYDLQRLDPAVMDLRGCFRTDAEGRYWLRTVRPLGYLIPMDGPVGDMIRAQKRHGFRPAHIHFLISAPRKRELVTALYLGNDAHIASDTVFGVAESLITETKINDANSPFPEIPSIQFNFMLGRADESGPGRVGADPAQLTKHTSDLIKNAA